MRSIRRILTLATLVALVAVPAGLPVFAQSAASSTPTRIQHRQSVLTQVDPTGLYGESIVVTQLLVTGEGPTEVVLEDQATDGLRNLEGFGAPSISGSTVTWSIDATRDGTLRRTVAEVDPMTLPVAMTITYTLDGEDVTPNQLLGKTGFLTVTYTLENLTAEEREVRYFDGQGRPRTETVEVAVPIGGTFETELDARFVEVTSEDATAIAGDGSGNTAVNGSFTLFPPAGATTQSFSWSAWVSDAVVPAATITLLPVSSRVSPAVGSGQDQLDQLITGFKDITNGGLILNSNLLRLSDGAKALADGLTGSAAPGAQQLADGLQKQAAPGSKQLSDALTGQIAPGARSLADGLTGQAAPGLAVLTDGLEEAAVGTGALAQLSAGVAAAFGPDGGGLDAGDKLAAAAAGATAVRVNLLAGILFAPGNVDASTTVLTIAPGAAAGNDLCITAATLMADGPVKVCLAGTKTIVADAGFNFTAAPINGVPVYGALMTIAAGLSATATALGDWPASCEAAIAAAQTGTPSGLEAIRAMECIAGPLNSGIVAAAGGADRLREGVSTAAMGATALANGIDQASAGAKTLSSGLGAAAKGAGDLADGLGDAADGAETIAGGTVTLSEAIEDSLIGGTTDAAAGLSLQLEQLKASDQRGLDNEGLLFGVAEGADVSGVYKFEIAGMGGAGQPSSATLALVAMIALALAGLVGFAVRQRVVA